MEEEARNTERHNRFTGSDSKLRHTAVNFVSAGPLENSETEDLEELERTGDPQHAMESMTLSSYVKGPDCESRQNRETKLSGHTEPIKNMDSDRYENGNTHRRDGRSKNREIDLGHRSRSEASPTPSNSSEEVILFRGRALQAKTTKPIDERIKTIEDKIHEKEELLVSLHNGGPLELVHDNSMYPTSTRAESSKENYSRRGRRHGKSRAQDAYQEALIADYIANIDKDDALFESAAFKQRELGGAHDSAWQDDSDHFSAGFNGNARKAVVDGWDHSFVSDFNDLSTSDAIRGDVQTVLSKRNRKASLQYLVVWDGQSEDEAKWVPAKSLTTQSALKLIEIFEAEAKLIAQVGDSGNTTDSDESDDDLVDEEDEQDLLQRKRDRMTDEDIARLLSKQEELGLGSNEVVLFDGLLAPDEEDEEFSARLTFKPLKISTNQRTAKARGGKRRQDEFPSASVLADAYDGFDVVDFDRPSLKKKPKGRRGKPAYDLSDSELEASMEMAWSNDRLKKKERKEERESLRQQGLLGRKGDKPDLKQKHREGMSIDEVKGAIKDFLMSENTT